MSSKKNTNDARNTGVLISKTGDGVPSVSSFLGVAKS